MKNVTKEIRNRSWEAKKRRYLKNPCYCPYCHSSLLDEKEINYAYDGHATQRVSCDKCGKEWIDNYTLTGITELPNT